MVALVQIAEGALVLSAGERLPGSVVRSNLGAVRGKVELRVGPQVGRDLFGAQFVHAQGIGFERWVCGFKFRLDLVPGISLLSGRGADQERQSPTCDKTM